MPERRGRTARLLLALALWTWSCVAFAAPRIGVVTMQPGEIFFERFGHNAIVVADPVDGNVTSYNFGFFDPTEEDFIARFVRGDMRYRLVALPLEQDLEYYRDVGRGVSLQWLDLDPQDAAELAAALAENARPENAHYGYDYFLDNCSTRVRDALDRALGGRLHQQLDTRRATTFRSESTRLASPDFWMWLGFDIGLGPAADVPLDGWAEAFVPMRLEDELAATVNRQGRPLVVDQRLLIPHRLRPEPEVVGTPRPWWPWLLAGLGLAAVVVGAGARLRRTWATVAFVFWLVSGLLSALMLFIWFGTAHEFGWANRNLLLFSPVGWLLLPAAWRVLRRGTPARWATWLAWVVAAGSACALVMYWLEPFPQRHLHWIVAILPVQLALAWTLQSIRGHGTIRR